MNRYWFKRKKYGYGWRPATKEGVLVTVFYGLMTAAAWFVLLWDVNEDTVETKTYQFLAATSLITIVFVMLNYKRGPKPKWRWGEKDTDNPEEDL